MTSPASGRADFQTSAQWVSPTTLYSSTAYIGSNNLVEGRTAGNWLTYRVSASCVAGAGNIRVDMWDSATKNVLIDQHIVTMRLSSSFNIAYPISGAFVELYVDTPLGVGTTMILQTEMNNVPVARPTSTSMPAMTETNFATIGAGGTETTNLTTVVPGDGWFYFSDEDASGKCTFTLEAYNNQGVLQNRVAQGRLLVNPMMADFIAPPNTLAVVIHNTDAVAHNCSFCIIQKG